ncbi:MAG: LuxR C-terminal-related transcriptional regulator [Leptolyngbyaceae cyanobacterium bins.302]|nr:LuxR C-terminal-related transcriptional regulator [Leptolyngbyaceae cyanobacterium bins.302]
MKRIKYSSSTSLTPTHNLSVRELEVLKIMAAGQSNSEIAAHLYLSHNTIKTPRNRETWQELLIYLDKHQHEMIDYDRRQKVGKPIGSGRVEKAVDQVIGHRQKHKGAS